MCGRYTLLTKLEKIRNHFGGIIPPEYEHLLVDLQPRYNIAPTTNVVAIRQVGDERQIVPLRWGLIPSWAKDEKIAFSTINARAETVAEKPAFRSAFQRRRCLIPADGWYEWKSLGPKSKQPYRMHYPDDRPFGLAGLWESWRQGAKTVESCTIIVTAAAPHLAGLHDRSPCIIRPEEYNAWLDPEFAARAALEAMLRAPDEAIEAYPVSSAVGNVRNTGAELVKRIEL